MAKNKQTKNQKDSKKKRLGIALGITIPVVVAGATTGIVFGVKSCKSTSGRTIVIQDSSGAQLKDIDCSQKTTSDGLVVTITPKDESKKVGSIVKITIGNKDLQPNDDYTFDAATGTLTIKTHALENPGEIIIVPTIDDREVSEIVLSKTSYSIGVGESFKISATLKYKSNEEAKITWHQKAGGTGKVDFSKFASASGEEIEVTATQSGSVDIEAICDTKAAVCSITITDKPVTGLQLSTHSQEIETGNTFNITATLKYSNADKITWSIVPETDPIVKLSTTESGSGDPITVTGLKAGEGKIIAKCGTFVESCAVTVTGKTVSDVKINNKPTSVKVGGTFDTSATISYANADQVTWSYTSTDGGKVSFSATQTASGVTTTVTGVTKGTVTITAKYNDTYKDSFDLTITEKTVTTKKEFLDTYTKYYKTYTESTNTAFDKGYVTSLKVNDTEQTFNGIENRYKYDDDTWNKFTIMDVEIEGFPDLFGAGIFTPDTLGTLCGDEDDQNVYAIDSTTGLITYTIYDSSKSISMQLQFNSDTFTTILNDGAKTVTATTDQTKKIKYPLTQLSSSSNVELASFTFLSKIDGTYKYEITLEKAVGTQTITVNSVKWKDTSLTFTSETTESWCHITISNFNPTSGDPDESIIVDATSA